MTSRVCDRTILLVNPWRGVIGPNVVARQVAEECLRRGWRTHLALPAPDEYLQALECRGAVFHYHDRIELTPRSTRPAVLVPHLARTWRLARRLGGLARRIGADGICVNSENMLLAPRAGQMARCPVTVILHGQRFGELGWVGRVYFGLQRQWVNHYVALTALGARTLEQLGVARGKIAVVPNGVDTEVYRPDGGDGSIRESLALAPADPLVGTVTHLTPRKGVHHLVEAAARVVACIPRARFLVAGQAPAGDEAYADSLRSRIAELSLGDRVLLLGRRSDIPQLLRACDLVVHPSETENCPLAVIEAQASGRPVVGFDVGGMSQVVQPGRTGLLVPCGDAEAMAQAVTQLLGQPQRRGEMGRAARAWALERFDLRTNLGRLAELLAEPAGTPAAPCGDDGTIVRAW